MEQMTQMLFAKDNNVIEALPPDRADDPLRISVLPWRPSRDRSITYAHCSNAPDERIAIRAIPITNEVSRRFVPATGFGQLTGDPFGTRMRGHTEPQKLPARMPQDQESI
jgi:hypothetical protein